MCYRAGHRCWGRVIITPVDTPLLERETISGAHQLATYANLLFVSLDDISYLTPGWLLLITTPREL